LELLKKKIQELESLSEAPQTHLELLKTKLQVLESKLKVLKTQLEALESKFEVPRIEIQAPTSRLEVPGGTFWMHERKKPTHGLLGRDPRLGQEPRT
jgi:hypothetical protein